MAEKFYAVRKGTVTGIFRPGRNARQAFMGIPVQNTRALKQKQKRSTIYQGKQNRLKRAYGFTWMEAIMQKPKSFPTEWWF